VITEANASAGDGPVDSVNDGAQDWDLRALDVTAGEPD
jgi:hypothetical protein